jgi:DNA-binding MarR family transcriptional regulator
MRLKAKAAPHNAHADVFSDLLGYHVRRASVAVMADLSATLAPLGLKPAEASILFVIAANPGTTQSEVGKTLGILRANMAPLIAALIKKGCIERRPVDGRSQALRLSAAGEVLCRRAKAATRSHEDRLFGALSPAARRRLLVRLRTLWQRG